MYYYLDITPEILQKINDLIVANNNIIDHEQCLLALLDPDYDANEYNRSRFYINRFIEFHNFLNDLKENPSLSFKQYMHAHYYCAHCSNDFRVIIEAFKVCHQKVSPPKMNISISSEPFAKSTDKIPKVPPKNSKKKSMHYLAMYNTAKARGTELADSIVPPSLKRNSIPRK